MKKLCIPVLALAIGVSFATFSRSATASNETIDRYRELAHNGDSNAQVRLGGLYAKGQGVSLSEPTALKWFRRAAEQGHVGAQLQLSDLLMNTKSMAANPVEAYKWAFLARARAENAGERGRAAELVASIGSKMSPAQIQAAKNSASDFAPRAQDQKGAAVAPGDDEASVEPATELTPAPAPVRASAPQAQPAPEVEQNDEPKRPVTRPARSRYEGARYDGEKKRRSSRSDNLDYALARARASGFNVPDSWERRARSRMDRW